MPGAAEVLDIGFGLQDLQDLGRLRQTLDEGINVERAEAPPEVAQLSRRQVLVAEEDHLVIEIGPVDLVKGLVGQLLRQLDSEYFGTEGVGERLYLDRLIAHGTASRPRSRLIMN